MSKTNTEFKFTAEQWGDFIYHLLRGIASSPISARDARTLSALSDIFSVIRIEAARGAREVRVEKEFRKYAKKLRALGFKVVLDGPDSKYCEPLKISW